MIKTLIPPLVLPAIPSLVEGLTVLETPSKRWLISMNGRVITADNGTILTAGR